MKHLKLVLPLVAAGAGLAAQPAYAHGFGERYDLPVPLGYFLVGAGAAVLLSFAVIGAFVRGGEGRLSYRRYNLLGPRWLRGALTFPLLLWALKLLSVFLLGLIIATGLAGSQTSFDNFAPTFVWIIWWVGLGFVVALVGNLWALLNPWKIAFEWAEWVYQRLCPGARLSFNEAYPPAWGMGPALILLLAFAWVENAYADSGLPSRLGILAIAYTVITLGGMVYFGKHQWLRRREAFSVVFGFLARFSPTEVRVRGEGRCRVCSAQCLNADRECIDCFEGALAECPPICGGVCF